MTKSHCSWTLFPWEISPKTRNSKYFRTLVHTITLNTVTKYKYIPYIQISFFGPFLPKNLKTLKND